VTVISLIEHGEISDEKCQPTFSSSLASSSISEIAVTDWADIFRQDWADIFCHVFFDAATPPPGIFGAATPSGADIFVRGL